MKDWQFGVVTISVVAALISIVWGLLWMTMAKDIAEKSAMQEQAIIEYKWQLDQVQYVCNRGE